MILTMAAHDLVRLAGSQDHTAVGARVSKEFLARANHCTQR